MRHLRLLLLPLCLVVTAAAACAGDPDPEPVANDAKAILGKWKLATIVVRGKVEEKPEDGIGEFSKDTLVVRSPEGKEKEKFTYKLDPKKKPAWIDINGAGGGKMEKVAGIYKLEKDRLTIAVTVAGPSTRPTRFDGPDLRVLTFERVKAKAK